MDKTEIMFWGISGVAMLGWFVGWVAGADTWIHTFLLVSVMLGVFALLHARQQAARR